MNQKDRIEPLHKSNGEYLAVFDRNRKMLLLLSVILGSGLCAPAGATTFTEAQALDFGEWAVLGNHGVYTITLQANGSYTSSPQVIMITPPQVGIYNVSGLPANTVFNSVNVTMVQPMEKVGSEDFSMDTFDVNAPNADSAGETTITLGAAAHTSGNGTSYQDGVYSGTLNIELNY